MNMAEMRRWCRVNVVGPDGSVMTTYPLDGRGSPDVADVDIVARWALVASRLGCRLRLTEVDPAMGELLELAGLGVEVERQAEVGEEPLGGHGAQEEIHPRDLPA